MSLVDFQVRDGKAEYDGLTLREWVSPIVERLVEAFDPVQVVLFGSVARDDDGRDSDIDLLVVLPRLEGRHHDAAVSMLEALIDYPVPVDVVVTDVAELRVRSELPGVIRVALREGDVIHGR